MPVRPGAGAHIDFGPACEGKGHAQAALGYNALVQRWPQIARRGHVVGSVLRAARREGKVVYERP